MVHRPDLAGGRHTISSEGTLSLPASYLDKNTWQVVRNVTINLRGPVSLELVASSRNPHWFYLVQYVARTGQYICTCLEHKGQGWCPHIPETTLTELV
jgi:hypothetical protein